MYPRTLSPQAQLEALARQKRWAVREVDVPRVGSFDGWRFDPLTPDSTLNSLGVKRLEEVAALVPVKQVIIGHQTLPLLPAPNQEKVRLETEHNQLLKHVLFVGGGLAGIMLMAGSVLAVLGIIALAKAIIALLIEVVSTVAMVMLLIVAAAVLVDPVVIVILGDGTAYEIFRSYD